MVLFQPPFHHTENALGLGKYFKAIRKYFMHKYKWVVLVFSDWKFRRITFYSWTFKGKGKFREPTKPRKIVIAITILCEKTFFPYVYQTMNCPLIFTTKVLDWNPSETALILTRSCVFKNYSRPFADAKKSDPKIS